MRFINVATCRRPVLMLLTQAIASIRCQRTISRCSSSMRRMIARSRRNRRAENRRCRAYPERLRLFHEADREAVDHRFALSMPALPSAPSKKSFSSVNSPIFAWTLSNPQLSHGAGLARTKYSGTPCKSCFPLRDLVTCTLNVAQPTSSSRPSGSQRHLCLNAGCGPLLVRHRLPIPQPPWPAQAKIHLPPFKLPTTSTV